MARVFYTERDIEDLSKRGVREIEVNNNVYLTDLARERMELLGIKAKSVPTGLPPVGGTPAATSPAPSGVSQTVAAPAAGLTESERLQVIEKVKSGVIARLGPGVDASMVETVVRRVVGQL